MRLSFNLRRSIADRIVDHKFKALIDAAKLELHKAGDAIYNIAYTADERKFMAKLPKEAFKTSINATIYCGGYRDIQLSSYRPVYFDNPRLDPMEKSVHEAFETYTKLTEQVEELRKARKNESSRVFGILERFFTTEKLVEAWPEIETFVPGADAKPAEASGLPVELISEINTRLCLPPTGTD